MIEQDTPNRGHLKCVLSVVLLGFAPVLTQAADSGAELEEIVVTSGKMGEQSLQRVSGSIQAITQQSIQKDVMSGFDDYARQVPSLATIDKGPGQTQIAIRGVLNALVNFGQPQSQSTTGMYINDVAVTSESFNPDVGLVDVSRIEVLKGPQGSLYGASAMSGAIRIIPNMPRTDRVEASVGAVVSDTHHGGFNYQTNGTLNLPLSDTFAVRATLYKTSNDGFIDNVYTGKRGYNSDSSYGGRLLAAWKPIDELSVTAMYLHHKLQTDGRPDQYAPGDPTITQKVFGDGSVHPIIAPSEDPSQFAVTRDLQTVKFIKDGYEDKFDLVSLTTEYRFPVVTLTAVGSYLANDNRSTLDDSQRIRAFFGPTNFVTNTPWVVPLILGSAERKATFELRLSSNPGAHIKWLIGGYYEHQHRPFTIAAPIADWDKFLNGIGVLQPGQSSDVVFGTPEANEIFAGGDDIRGKQTAVFGEITVPLPMLGGDKFFLVAGGRRYEYDNTVVKSASGFVNGGATSSTIGIKESGFNPKGSLEFRPTEDLLFYGSVATGFRIGGTNEAIPPPSVIPIGPLCASELASLGIQGQTSSYGSDSLTSYELGGKTTMAGGRMRMNAALYYVDWKDIQTNVFLSCGFNIKTNGGSQVSKGVEWEVNALLTNAWRLNVGASYTDARLNQDSKILGASKGDRAPYVPKWNVSAGSEYRWKVKPFAFESELYLRGDVSYVGDSYSEYSTGASAQRVQLPSSTTGNLYFGIDTDHINAGLFVKNLWDERIVTSVDVDRLQSPQLSQARPRTVGASFNYRW